MSDWSFLGGLFESLQAHSPMLGRFWLLLMLVFRMLILGTVASDLFEDEQEEFVCNTLQPGCKQVCYDEAFPISQYRFWVFHIVLIATPALVFLIYSMHHHNKKAIHSKYSQCSSQDYREDHNLRRLYIVHLIFRIFAEVGFLVGQWWMYGFKVEAQFLCSRFPCPHVVDCFTSRPAEKTIFLYFYFSVGVLAAIFSCVELFHSSLKWFCSHKNSFPPERSCVCQNLENTMHEEEAKEKGLMMSVSSSRLKGSQRSSTSRKVSSIRSKGSKSVNNKTLMV